MRLGTPSLRFIDLFAGIGGFHRALTGLGHQCVFASEIDAELRELYLKNFPSARGVVYGDIREWIGEVPAHDILCAGFPCQPFSKSGERLGVRDETRGTLFHDIVTILEKHRPQYVLLENVGNFERLDEGRTWKIVRARLEALDYTVRGTEHVTSGGPGLISPHHLGYPHTRERFFVVASQGPLPESPFPKVKRKRRTSLADVVQSKSELSPRDRIETALSEQQIDCINHWNKILARIPERVELPSFPIWGDEILATYPFERVTPHECTARELRRYISRFGLPRGARKRHLLAQLPSYARTRERRFPGWKVDFIRQNRDWFNEVLAYIPLAWISKLMDFPPSLRKLEWNCRGEERDLWKYVLQFRPSGLRVKRYTSCPALVAMTTTQIPILGPKRRFITRTEGLRLQGFPDGHKLPDSREAAFNALGNAVHVKVVKAIATRLLGRQKPLLHAVALSPRNGHIALTNGHVSSYIHQDDRKKKAPDGGSPRAGHDS
jgi:DNA (cytosine-5)-methyltransferase 1